MKTVAVLLLSISALSFAEQPTPDTAKEKKRLQSVTWDLKEHKLVWVVQKGSMVDGEFQPTSQDRYEVSPDEAKMFFANEARGFTPEEGAALHQLLDTLSLYCAESTVWWEDGQGDRLDKPTEETAKVKPTPVEEKKKQQPAKEQPAEQKRDSGGKKASPPETKAPLLVAQNQ